MFFHENEKCPVCDKLFTSDDDIVICPRCGTPHHRECYNQLGHCANSDKHKDGFVYTAPKIDADVQSNSDDNAQTSTFNPNNSYYSNTVENKATKHKCNNCGQEIDNTAPFCFKCGAKQDNPDYKQYVNVNIPFENQSDYGNNNDTIEGKSIKDVAYTVKSNVGRFIQKFKSNKKVSWNWGAFFFGPYYLFFRKMHKQGVVALAIRLIASLVIQGVYVEEFNDLYNMYNTMLNSKGNVTQDFINRASVIVDAVTPAITIMFAVTLVINIVIALFADSFYKKKVISVIDKLDKNIEDTELLEQNGFIRTEGNMSKESMRAMYLSRMGGTSIFSPIIAYMLLNIVVSIISSL